MTTEEAVDVKKNMDEKERRWGRFALGVLAIGAMFALGDMVVPGRTVQGTVVTPAVVRTLTIRARNPLWRFPFREKAVLIRVPNVFEYGYVYSDELWQKAIERGTSFPATVEQTRLLGTITRVTVDGTGYASRWHSLEAYFIYASCILLLSTVVPLIRKRRVPKHESIV